MGSHNSYPKKMKYGVDLKKSPSFSDQSSARNLAINEQIRINWGWTSCGSDINGELRIPQSSRFSTFCSPSSQSRSHQSKVLDAYFLSWASHFYWRRDFEAAHSSEPRQKSVKRGIDHSWSRILRETGPQPAIQRGDLAGGKQPRYKASNQATQRTHVESRMSTANIHTYNPRYP